MWKILFFFFLIKHSVQDNNGLLNVNVNLKPVIDLLADKTTTESTTTDVTTSSPLYSYFSSSVAPRISENTESSCGKRQIIHTGLIMRGQPTKPGDWPWHVALYKLKTSNSEQQYICGGTLLSHTRVLTAGHCVVENGAVVLPERLYAIAGKYNLAGGDIDAQERPVFEIILHPDFSQTNLTNDIALLKLSSRVTFSEYVQPICLWDKSDRRKTSIVDKHGTIVGWGFTQQDGLANELMKTDIPVKNDLECVKSNPLFYSRFLTDKTFCAGHANGTSACNGDSGGGMYFSEQSSNGEEIWSLRGIVSLSVSRSDKNICDANFYTIFTDAAQYLDFIKNHMSVAQAL